MLPTERDILRAIDRGDRQFDWQAWFGDTEAVGYLSTRGRELSRRMADDLTAFFGRNWLPKATEPGAKHFIREFGAQSPLLEMNERRQLAAWVETLRWWASLQFHEGERTVGLDTLRRQTRTDISADRLRHSLAQARLGVLGASVGAEVVLEPSKVRGPGDVLLTAGDCSLFVEVVTSLPVVNADEQAFDWHWMYLVTAEGDDLHWEGAVPGWLNKTDEQSWRTEVDAAAARCRAQGMRSEVAGNWEPLAAVPGRSLSGRTITGPSVEFDLGSKLIATIDGKAGQTSDAGIAWIWIEDEGSLDSRTEFARMPLDGKLRSLAALVKPVLAERTHVGGVIWTRALHSEGPADEQTTASSDGFATQRLLPGGRVRQTVVVHQRLILPYQLRLLERMLDQEAKWLDWALEKLGAGRLADLLA